MGARPDRGPRMLRQRFPGQADKGDGMEETVVTLEGLARLSEELERLKTIERQGIAERLRLAAGAETNRAENGDYPDARKHQARLEHRIAALERGLRAARLVEPRPGNGRVDVGERVN